MGERKGGNDPCDPPSKRTFVRRAWDYLSGLFGSGADKGYKSNARLRVNNNVQIGIPTNMSEEEYGNTSWNAGNTHYERVTRNTLITRKIGANNESPQYRFILPQNFGGWSQDNTGSDGLIWKGCLSCHSDNGAFTYAVHNSQEANAGHMLSAILQAVAGASIGSSSSSSKLNALSSEEMANIWGAGGFKAAPVELFDKAGIEYTEHFAVRISGRASRGVTPEKALDAYRNGRMYYNTETGNYIRHNSTTKISVVVDKLKDGKAITVFEGNLSPTWNIIKFKK